MNEFSGTERFQLIRRLGAGGMGVVYEAFDREQELRVALKCLHETDATALLTLKQEFRSLRDVQHVNLVSFGELVETKGQWFFTMELVEGSHLLEYVRTGVDPAERDTNTASTSNARGGLGSGSRHPTVTVAFEDSSRTGGPVSSLGLRQPRPIISPVTPVPLRFLEDRLRRVLVQLTYGLEALHLAGKVHRDLKSPNLLVSHQGRLAISDFGLVIDAEMNPGNTGTPKHIHGTPPYIAPELVTGASPEPSSDWFSVGVVLYYALVGRTPFRGELFEMQSQKLSGSIASPKDLVEGVPDDLNALCMSLLNPLAHLRPTGRNVLTMLGAEPERRQSTQPRIWVDRTPFVGREAELKVLEQAWKQSGESGTGAAAAVVIQGESGCGKSALVGNFSEQLHQREPRLLWLGGRCHERESVPYKALDGVMDELTRHLTELPPEAVQGWLPPTAGLLTQLFPVLRQIPALADVAPSEDMGANAKDHRALLFLALRELIESVAQHVPLVIGIDDLQWADPDSFALLRELTRAPAPKFLLLATVRTPAASPWSPPPPLEAALGPSVRHILLQKLPAEAAQLLTREWARMLGLPAGLELTGIAESADGHPLFIQELVFRAAEPSEAGALGPLSSLPGKHLLLDDVLYARMQQLPPQAVLVLELTALAGKPLPNGVIRSAAALDTQPYSDARRRLERERFVRSAGLRKVDQVEPFHDRIRETVIDRLSPEARTRLHRQLARALEGETRVDAELLGSHWLGAGEFERARPYLLRAAAEADQALAFSRSVRLYQQWLSLVPEAATALRQPILEKLADAVSKDGRSAEAGALFLSNAQHVTGPRAVELRQRAAIKFLRSGHFQRGIDALKDALSMVGVGMPSGLWRSLLYAAFFQAKLDLKKRKVELKPANSMQEADKIRADALYTGSIGLFLVDMFLAQSFSARYLLAAYGLGDRERLVRGLTVQYVTNSSRNPESSVGKRHIQTADELALGRPELQCLCATARFSVALVNGIDLPGVLRDALACEAYFLKARAYHDDLYLAQHFTNAAHYYLGNWSVLGDRLDAQLRSASERDDLFTTTNLITGPTTSIFLRDDQPEKVAAMLKGCMNRWPRHRFLMAHFFELHSVTQLAQYRGLPFEALRILEERWSALRNSLLMWVPLVRYIMRSARSTVLMQCAAESEGGTRAHFIRRARRDAKAVKSTKIAFNQPAGHMLQGGLARLEGKTEVAARCFQDAEDGFKRAEMKMHAAAARYAQGKVLGGEGGATMCAEARAAFAGQGVESPEKMLRIFVV